MRASVSTPRPRAQPLGDEGRDVGLGQTSEQQIGIRLHHRVDGHECVGGHRHAVVDPGLMHLLGRAVVALVSGLQQLVARTHHQRRDPQHCAPLGACRRRERAIAAIGRVEMVDDRAGVEENLAVVEHQRRNAAERVHRPHVGAIAEAAQRLLLERDAIGRERDRDAARVGRAIRLRPAALAIPTPAVIPGFAAPLVRTQAWPERPVGIGMK